MLQFKIIIMLICVGPEPDLLHHDLGGFGLHLFLFLLLLVKKLLIIDGPAHRGICLGRDLHQVEVQRISNLQGFSQGNHSWIINVLSNKANCGSTDRFVGPEKDPVFVTIVLSSTIMTWSCYD